MAEIFIHIGLHKTGTTTLQKQFFPACQGLNYIQDPALGKVIYAITTQDPVYFDSKSARQTMLAHASGESPNLISKEALSGALSAAAIKRGLDHRTPILDNLKATIPEAHIILVLRRQDGFARSLYRQYLKRGGTEKLDAFFGLNGKCLPLVPFNIFRYGPYVDYLEASFSSRILVLAFEEFLHDQPEFLKKITDFMGIEVQEVGLHKTNQTTLGAVGLEASRMMNRLCRTAWNPGGIFPGIPRYRRSRVKWVSPMEAIHSSWPWKRRLKTTSALYRVGMEILDQVREENRILDDRWQLGLGRYGYY